MAKNKSELKEIYLPAYAKRQLEASDNALIWAKPIPYSPVPTENHPYKLDLTHKSFQDIIPIQKDGYFYPDLTEPDSVLELLTEVKSKKSKSSSLTQLLTPSTEHLNDVYRRFVGNDAECWARLHNGRIEEISQFTYVFTGLLNGPSRFAVNQYRSIDKVLEEGAGIFLNPTEVNLCNDGAPDIMGKSYLPLNFTNEIKYTGNERVSLNGKTYKLFFDYDSGARGWAILTEKQKKRMSILDSDHTDNVRSRMLDIGEFAKNLGLKINFKEIDKSNHDFYSVRYVPVMEDFEDVKKTKKRKK